MVEDYEAPITSEQKEEIIASILDMPQFAGERAGKILRYLFDRHRLDPTQPPTQTDIFENVYAGNYDSLEPAAMVRAAVKRLRTFLDEFFDGPGFVRNIRVRLPKGGYRLEFYRTADERDVIQWFWGNYFLSERDPLFGMADDFEPALSGRVGLEYLYAYELLARMMARRLKDLRVSRKPWRTTLVPNWSFLESPQPLIVLGDSVLLTPDTESHTPSGHPHEKYLCGIIDQLHFRWIMYRDPLGTTMVSTVEENVTQLKFTPRVFPDASERVYVLLTRCTVNQSGTSATILTASSALAIWKVVEFITSEEGLRRIASLTDFQKPIDRPPADFQIVFSVTMRAMDKIEYFLEPLKTRELNHTIWEHAVKVEASTARSVDFSMRLPPKPSVPDPDRSEDQDWADSPELNS